MKKNFFCFLYLHEGYVEDMKQLLFTLTKPEMAEVYSRYSCKAPEPLTAQFNDRMDKQTAVKRTKRNVLKEIILSFFQQVGFCHVSGVALRLSL